MSDKTLASEKDIEMEDESEAVPTFRSSKRRNAIIMSESEKAKLMEHIAEQETSLFGEVAAAEDSSETECPEDD
jgi:hypothetical protein